MEILKFLLSFFLEEYGGEKLMPIFNALKENSFDIKKTLQNINPETAAPILKSLFDGGFKGVFGNAEKSSPTGKTYGLEPISEIADKEIVYTLNKYFYN